MKKERSEAVLLVAMSLAVRVGKEAFKLIVVVDTASEALAEGSVRTLAASKLCNEAAQVYSGTSCTA